jgi:ABC-type uncharacterized transport system ATPase subunit
MDTTESKKFICECFEHMENNMLIEVLDRYYKGDYDKFRRNLEFMDELLRVKEKLKCPI